MLPVFRFVWGLWLAWLTCATVLGLRARIGASSWASAWHTSWPVPFFDGEIGTMAWRTLRSAPRAEPVLFRLLSGTLLLVVLAPMAWLPEAVEVHLAPGQEAETGLAPRAAVRTHLPARVRAAWSSDAAFLRVEVQAWEEAALWSPHRLARASEVWIPSLGTMAWSAQSAAAEVGAAHIRLVSMESPAAVQALRLVRDQPLGLPDGTTLVLRDARFSYLGQLGPAAWLEWRDEETVLRSEWIFQASEGFDLRHGGPFAWRAELDGLDPAERWVLRAMPGPDLGRWLLPIQWVLLSLWWIWGLGRVVRPAVWVEGRDGDARLVAWGPWPATREASLRMALTSSLSRDQRIERRQWLERVLPPAVEPGPASASAGLPWWALWSTLASLAGLVLVLSTTGAAQAAAALSVGAALAGLPDPGSRRAPLAISATSLALALVLAGLWQGNAALPLAHALGLVGLSAAVANAAAAIPLPRLMTWGALGATMLAAVLASQDRLRAVSLEGAPLWGVHLRVSGPEVSAWERMLMLDVPVPAWSSILALAMVALALGLVPRARRLWMSLVGASAMGLAAILAGSGSAEAWQTTAGAWQGPMHLLWPPDGQPRALGPVVALLGLLALPLAALLIFGPKDSRGHASLSGSALVAMLTAAFGLAGVSVGGVQMPWLDPAGWLLCGATALIGVAVTWPGGWQDPGWRMTRGTIAALLFGGLWAWVANGL
jgi:hypothetical protein